MKKLNWIFIYTLLIILGVVLQLLQDVPQEKVDNEVMNFLSGMAIGGGVFNLLGLLIGKKKIQA